MHAASSAWSAPTSLSPPLFVSHLEPDVHLRRDRTVRNAPRKNHQKKSSCTMSDKLWAQALLRWGNGVVSGGGGPKSFPASLTGMGVCSVRSANTHSAMANFFVSDLVAGFGVVSTHSADAFNCPCFLGRFEPESARVRGICVQCATSKSSA
jgi:hypothetical protein